MFSKDHRLITRRFGTGLAVAGIVALVGVTAAVVTGPGRNHEVGSVPVASGGSADRDAPATTRASHSAAPRAAMRPTTAPGVKVTDAGSAGGTRRVSLGSVHPPGSIGHDGASTGSPQGGAAREQAASELTCGGLVPTIVGTAGPDVLTGTALPDVIHALAGDDVVDGAGRDDVICGGQGNDVLHGGSGFDTLIGEGDVELGAPGDDRLFGGPDSDVMVGDASAGNLAGHDYLDGGSGFDTLIADNAQATGVDARGNDVLVGGDDSDTLIAGNGDGATDNGDDDLQGGAGFDTLDGAGGTDRCDGGHDADVDTAATCEVVTNVP